MPECSHCGLPTDPHPYHSWAIHCIEALRKARAQDAAKLAAYDLLAEHYESLEASVDELTGRLATTQALADDYRREAAELRVRLAQREATAEVGG